MRLDDLTASLRAAGLRRGDIVMAPTMRPVRLALSFDHELSLGGTSSYEDNLFQPTERLLTIARELGVPITLFTDVACAIRFQDWDARRFFDPYRAQLARAIQEGHDVQLHIHPHWFDSTYVAGRFRPATTYALSHFAARPWPNNIEGIIERSVAFLSKICAGVDPHYCCVAYRAGGHNLAPETPRILCALYTNGIRIESSIAKGYYFESAISSVDFRDMPRRANWRIAPDGPLHREASDGFLEVPIASRPRSAVNSIPYLAKRVLHRGRAMASTGQSFHKDHTSIAQKLARLVQRSAWMLSFDLYAQSVDDQMRTFRYHMNHHRDDRDIICASISHPKSMGDHAFAMFRAFVQRVREQYGRQVEFCTYQQIAETMRLGHAPK
jgi:hypothetical protein